MNTEHFVINDIDNPKMVSKVNDIIKKNILVQYLLTSLLNISFIITAVYLFELPINIQHYSSYNILIPIFFVFLFTGLKTWLSHKESNQVIKLLKGLNIKSKKEKFDNNNSVWMIRVISNLLFCVVFAITAYYFYTKFNFPIYLSMISIIFFDQLYKLFEMPVYKKLFSTEKSFNIFVIKYMAILSAFIVAVMAIVKYLIPLITNG